MNQEAMITIVSQLGLAGVFIYLYYKTREDLRQDIEKKDQRLEQLQDKVLQSYNENTKVQEQTKNALESNTEATKILTSRVEDVLLGRYTNSRGIVNNDT